MAATLLVDEALIKAGQWGPSQKKYFFITQLAHMCMVFHFFASSYVDYEPHWTCEKVVRSPTSFRHRYLDSFDNLTLVEELGKDCNAYEDGLCSPRFEGPVTSTVTEWKLLCGRSYLARLPQSAFFLGTLVGNFVVGPFGDKYGRRALLYWSVVLLVAGSALSAVSIGITTYLLLRFFVGFVAQGVQLGQSIWIFELTGPDYRSRVQAYGSFFSLLGMTTLVTLSVFVYNWHFLLGLIACITSIPLLFMRKVPESPSWLLVNNRVEEAKAVLLEISQGNQSPLPGFELRMPEEKRVSKNCLSLFSFPDIAARTTFLLVCWFAVCGIYYGVVWITADRLGGNRYLNFAVGTLLEVPAVLMSIYVSDRTGRRDALAWLFFISGACFVCSMAVSFAVDSSQPELATICRVTLTIIGRMSNAAAFTIVYFYSSELFPTEVRNVGLSTVSVASRCGGMLSPFVLSAENPAVPLCLLGLVSTVAGVCTLKLPETKGAPVPDTLEELKMNQQLVAPSHCPA